MSGYGSFIEIGHEDEVTGNVKFDAASDVEAIWASKAVPDLEGNAVELSQILAECNGELKSVASKYGHYSMGDKGELSYIVKGQGKVLEVNREKKAGFMAVQLDGYAGDKVVKVQIGTVYKGSAIRDCISFIKYY